MNLSDLAFPVVLVTTDKTVSMPVDVEELATCTPLGLRKMLGSTIIDLNGAEFVVTTATKVATQKRWWQRPLFLTIIKADLALKQVRTLSLEELKKALVKGLKRSGWAFDRPDLIPRVRQARSLGEIRTIFSPDVCSVPRWYEFTPKKGPKTEPTGPS